MKERIVISIVFLCGVLGCGVLGNCKAPEPNVPLSDTWPTMREIDDDTIKTWIRQGVIRAPAKTAFAEYLDLYALIRSPSIRTAEVKRHVNIRGLSKAEEVQMVADERAKSSKNIEILLFATTYHRSHNDFASSESIWKVDLIINDKIVIPAKNIIRDRRPRPTIRSEYPWTGDFAEVYVAQFESAEPWVSSNKKIQLRVSSTIGNIKLAWKAP